jgi:hypothetical protein
MAEINSLADVIRFGDGLLEAIERNPEIRDSTEAERKGLAEPLGEVKSLKASQDELTAKRQETTQKLKGAVARTKEAAMRVQAAAKAKLGPRSELLVHFDVAPLRKRARKTVFVEVVKPPDGKEVGTNPGTVTVKPVA